jgi:hypothetical protein
MLTTLTEVVRWAAEPVVAEAENAPPAMIADVATQVARTATPYRRAVGRIREMDTVNLGG